MSTIGFRTLLSAVTLGCFLSIGVAVAQDSKTTEPERATSEEAAGPELPEKVAELVNAMSGVQRVEPLDNGLFAVHRRMTVTGSRIPRNVKLEIAEDGEVVDWGRTALYTRSVTRRELLETGEVDLAEALKRRDPAIQSGGGGG